MLLDDKTSLSKIRSAGAYRLGDIESVDLLFYLRHLYLDAAKDLIKSKDCDEVAYGLCHCEAAEYIQGAIEELVWYDY